MSNLKVALFSSSILIGVLAAAPVSAQSTPGVSAEDSTILGGVVVTARRKEEKLSDVPAAVSVLTPDAIKNLAISSPTDLVHAVPSLQQSSSGFGNATPHFLIRGQRQQLEFIQSDQSVGVYIDEIAVPRQQGLNAGLFDLSNIQVLKGPQGTLFGKNQTGGAILFTSQMPTRNLEGYISATAGNYSAKKFEGAVNVPLSDELQIRAALQINRRDGYVHNVTDGRDYNDVHTDGWRVSAHYEPEAIKFENWLILSGAKEKEIGPITKMFPEWIGLPGVGTSALFTAFGNPAGDVLSSASMRSQVRSYGKWESGGVSQYQLPNGDNIDISNFAVTNKTEFHVNDDMTLRNIFGYRFLRSYQSANIGGVAGFLLQPGTTPATATVARLLVTPDLTQNPIVPVPAGNIVCGPQSGVNCVVGGVFNSQNYTKQRQVSEELTLLGKALDGSLDYIVGGYYFREHGVGITSNFVPTSNGSRMGTAQNEPANDAKAIFGQVSWRPIPTVALTGGLRQTWDHRETNSRSVTIKPDYWPWQWGLIPADGVLGTCALVGNSGTLPNDTPSNPNNCLFSGSANFKKLTWTVSVDWHPTPDILLYAASRRGYRSGGFNQSATVNTTAQPTVLTPFQPEVVTDFEIGFKGSRRWSNGVAASFNIDYYHDNYDNIQRALTSVAGNKSVTANAATAVIQGVEVEARFEPTDWLLLSGFYSYVDAHFEKFIVPNNGLFRDFGDYTESKFSGVPEHSGGASATFHRELPNNAGRLAMTVDYYAQTENWLQDVNNYLAATHSQNLAQRVPGYWLLGLNISWTNVMAKPVDLSFNVRNLNDKQYFTGGVDGSTSGIGTTAFFLGEPRMYTFNVTYHF